MDPAVVGAFLSGIGAVLGAGVSLHLVRKHADEECDKRLQAFRDGFKMGRD